MPDNITPKERGEQWARAQREKLRQSTINKAEQLLEVYRQHIVWLRDHSTAESLIELRRPLKRVREDTEPEDEIQLVQSSRHCIGESSHFQRSLTTSRSGQHRSMLSNHLKVRSPSNSSTLSTAVKQKNKEKMARTSSNASAKAIPQEPPRPPSPPPPPASPEGEEDLGDNSDDEPHEVDPDFVLDYVPSWAESPELVTALARQSAISGDQVFGPIKPVATSDVFGRRRITHRV